MNLSIKKLSKIKKNFWLN